MNICEMQVGTITDTLDNLKKIVEQKLADYRRVVYTEETLKTAKEDRAYLNKQFDELDTARKAVKNEFMRPYNEFETKVKEVSNLIKSTSNEIGEQIKHFETAEKERKLISIRNLWTEKGGSETYFNTIYKPEWLNKSTSIGTIARDMDAGLKKLSDFRFLAGMNYSGKILEKCLARFEETGDAEKAISYARDLSEVAEAKPDYELTGESSVSLTSNGFIIEPKITKTYHITGTDTELMLLEGYMTREGITWKR